MSETKPAWGPIERKSVYDPQYPVVVKYPTVADVTSNMAFGDYARIVGFTAAGYGLGHISAHRPYAMRTSTRGVFAVIGLLGGAAASYLASRQRLTGFRPNQSEYDRLA